MTPPEPDGDTVSNMDLNTFMFLAGNWCFLCALTAVREYRAPFQYPLRRLVVKSHGVSMSRDWQFKSKHRFEIRQAPGQECSQACQISERYDDFKHHSCGFQTSRDLTIRRFNGYLNDRETLCMTQMQWIHVMCPFSLTNRNGVLITDIL